MHHFLLFTPYVRNEVNQTGNSPCIHAWDNFQIINVNIIRNTDCEKLLFDVKHGKQTCLGISECGISDRTNF